MKATITYSIMKSIDTAHNNSVVDRRNITYDGFESMHHAEMFAHQEAARLSAKTGTFHVMSNVHVDENNFVCECTPAYYAEGIVEIR